MTFSTAYFVEVAALLILFSLAVADRSASSIDGLHTTDVLALLTASLAVVNAFWQIERYRITANTSAVWIATASVLAAVRVTGLRVLPATSFGLDLGLVGAATLACTTTLLAVAAWIGLGAEVDTRVNHRTAGAVATVSFTALTVSFAALDLEHRTRLAPAPGPNGRLLLAVAATIVAVVLTMRAARERTNASPAWLGLFALAVAGAELAAAVNPAQSISANSARVAMTTVAALGLARAGELDLRQALARQSCELDLTRAEFLAAGDRERRAQAKAAERAHEARNALVAISGAIHTLERYQHRLSADTRAQLAAGMGAELVRLQRLVDVEDRREAPTTFRVADALGPLVTLARSDGLEVETDMRPDVETVACRDAVAEVVQNLLVNARRHADGRGVLVQVGTDGQRAIVRVLDRGPGVPSGQHVEIFERGRSSGSSESRGYGLYVSRRLVEAQGGSLVAKDRPGGGAVFEFDLPLSAPELDGFAPSFDRCEDVADAHQAIGG